MRLDKFIGHASDLTRSQIHILIRQKAVSVNGVITTKSAQHVTEQDVVVLDGERILPITNRYLMLHKPAGYICANSDSGHPTVLDLIDEPNKQLLQIVGRLDIDTTGLVLLTDDGQWNHRITAPRRECAKTYRVTTADPISEQTCAAFLAGILLHGEKKPTQPAELHQLSSHTGLLTIHEGKYHQIKRMFAAQGNRVIELHRDSIGPITLDPGLAAGEYRTLSSQEIESI
jgi:16S rRNA pseudouridine516 synthase